jgi:hypothetical protein
MLVLYKADITINISVGLLAPGLGNIPHNLAVFHLPQSHTLSNEFSAKKRK